MTRWKATLTYDGTPFHGWQVQPDRPTVQQTLADALHHVTGERTLPQGSGRTDTGVHALGQVASFDLATRIPPANLHHAVNRALPPSIRVLALAHAAADFHARHSALRKTYEYRILPRTAALETICPPMLAPYVWTCPYRLDPDRMNQAATHVLGQHDFTSFAAAQPDAATRMAGPAPRPPNTRVLYASAWTRDEPGPEALLRFRVTGSGFLHHMVRNLVGTFVEAGAGRLPPEALPGILAARDRRAAGPTAPPQGLFLASVDYGRDAD